MAKFTLFGKKDEELIDKELAKYDVIDEEEKQEKVNSEVVEPVQQASTIETTDDSFDSLNNNSKEFMIDNNQEANLEDDFDAVFMNETKGNAPIEKAKEENEEEYTYEYVEPHFTANAILIGIVAVLIGVFGAFLLFKDQVEEKYREAYLAQGYMLTNDAEATEKDIRVGKTAYVNGKLITGTYVDIDTTKATATPSDILKGYTAYVNGQLITGTIPTYKGVTSITPSTKNVTIPAGYYVTTPIIIIGDQDLVSKNIKENITIFDVKGIYKGQ